MDQFKKRYGEWALVAGAAEGIGQGFTTALAQRGINVVMADCNQDAMKQLDEEIKSLFGVDVKQVHIDLAQPDVTDLLLQSTSDLDCRLMIYVAAYSKVKPFLSNEKEELDTYMDVNSRTPIQLVHGFANRLQSQNSSGGIILVSSLAGLLGPPLVAPYAATKGFLIRLAESLSTEFKPLNIDISVCCAGLTATPTYQENTPEATRTKLKPMDPIQVADYAINQLGRKSVCIPGWKNRFNFFLLLRLLPRSFSSKILSKTMTKMYEKG